MAARRKLPILQEPKPSPGDASPGDGDGEDGAPRPRWHWVGFGTVAIFAVWLPLAYAAEALKRGVVSSYVGGAETREEVAARIVAMSAAERTKLAAVQALPHLLALALAAFAGGLLVGRFGQGTRVREAALAGASTAAIALVVAWRAIAEGGGGALLVVLVPSLVAVGFAAWGGRTGVRMRRGHDDRSAPGG